MSNPINHTPGPWRFRKGITDDRYRVGPVDGQFIVEMLRVGNDDTYPTSQVIANGRLIAAAPELLEACKDAIDSLGYCDEFDAGQLRQIIDETFPILRAAIARATGKDGAA